MKRTLPWLTIIVFCALNTRFAYAGEFKHALIIGIGQYSEASQTPGLPGVPKDMENARKMARAMGVDDQAIVELRDKKATKPNIVAELEKLRVKVQSGDRVFIYYSGHGTRFGAVGKCVEGLQTYSAGAFTDADVLSEEDLAKYTQPISEKADKIITLVDSCFSGGVLASKTRSLAADLGIRSKFNATVSDCSVAVNDRGTRGLVPALIRLGAAKENFVQIAAANYNEVSWDFPQLGGLATHSLTQCLLGEAEDLDRSGAISLEEVRHCAQQKVDEAMKPHAKYGRFSSTIQVRGSRNLIVAQEPPSAPVSPLLAPQADLQQSPPIAEVIPPVVSNPIPVVLQPQAPTPPTPQAPTSANSITTDVVPEKTTERVLASGATLRDIYEQRDGRLKIEVNAPKQLTIGKDPLKVSVRSNTDGYLYAVMLGSDAKSFYLLFPNKLDPDNRIKANIIFNLPRPGWSIKAGGPDGTNQILFVLSHSPRDPEIFPSDDIAGGGPFTFSVTDLPARKRLIDFFIGRGPQGQNGQIAASLISIKEVP
jgi:hypothetical protein